LNGPNLKLVILLKLRVKVIAVLAHKVAIPKKIKDGGGNMNAATPNA
jgi:hypothetical protein